MKPIDQTLSICVLIAFSCALDLNSIQAQELDYHGLPEWSWQHEDSTEYYLYTPQGLEPGKKYPVALFLHGCCGDNYKATLRNTVDPPARMWHNFGANTQTVPTYIIAPSTSRGWNQHMDRLKKVIDDLVEHGQADPQRIYITGFSMGGVGTVSFVQHYPEYFAAALPMGTNINGDLTKLQKTPLWANKGETGYFSKFLIDSVQQIWAHNGLVSDYSPNVVPGINPRLTIYDSVGHGVQWHAASMQDLVAWAYEKVNDDNQYPNVYFKSQSADLVTSSGKNVVLDIDANDPDGEIERIEIEVNGSLTQTLTAPPYQIDLKPMSGDNWVAAKAYDNAGKHNTAYLRIKVNDHPVVYSTSLPYARQGAFYSYQIAASGNGRLHFLGTDVPSGLQLRSNGQLSGIPTELGSFTIQVETQDEDGDITYSLHRIQIKHRRMGEVLVSQATNHAGQSLSISKLQVGETTTVTTASKEYPNFRPEVSFSDLGAFNGQTYIKTLSADAKLAGKNHISFTIDADADLIIGYGKRDRLFNSSIPTWLSEYEKIDGVEITAEYHHYDLYKKSFAAGRIQLAGADIEPNQVHTNYFVIVVPKSTVLDHPEINSFLLPRGSVGQKYNATLTTLYGSGALQWITADLLPKGIKLTKAGHLKGTPVDSGVFDIDVQVMDSKGQKDKRSVRIEID